MSQYLYYKFDQSSTTITNYGNGGAGYNGQASRNLKNQYSWGPMNAGDDVITVPSGISNPCQHTWQTHLVINQWWPVAGVDQYGTLCGNDGKLWAAANDTHYGYIHQQGSYPPLVEYGIYNFFVEIQGSGSYSADSVQFWVGADGARPIKQSAVTGEEGGRVWWGFNNFNLQLGVDYYFQVSINLDPNSWASGTDYYIGNCAPGCADTMVVGFPCGCYFYSWREDNAVIDLSQGGNWAEDMAGGGVTPPPGPPPSQIPDWAKTFPSLSEIDITQYLTNKYNGQPTPGQHSIEIVPGDGTAHVNAHVRVREKQPRRE
jgi:hypothetical protein